MSQIYDEILEGATLSRPAPGERHEKVCARLHDLMAAGIAGMTGAKLLSPRTAVQLSRLNLICPDLALVTSANGRLYLAVEIINRADHRVDTVTKKEIYEKLKVPRLWIVDPRYDNVEIYHSTDWGLALKGILAGSEIVTDALLPSFQVTVTDLFTVA